MPIADPATDRRFMAAAIALSRRGRGLSTPNPNVGCIIVRDGRVVGRGWTQKGGRPHAEAQALEQALDRAHGACCYVTLEPCFHLSPRGPRCADLLARAGVARVVIALRDPDPRTDGQGAAWLRERGIAVELGFWGPLGARAGPVWGQFWGRGAAEGRAETCRSPRHSAETGAVPAADPAGFCRSAQLSNPRVTRRRSPSSSIASSIC